MIRRTFLQMLGFSPLAAVSPVSDSPEKRLIAWYHQMHQNQLEATQHSNKRAFDTLEVAGFKQSELEQVRKDICNDMPSVNHHYWKFHAGLRDLNIPVSDVGAGSSIAMSRLAIVVTFRTGQDGFFALGIKPLSKEI